MNDMIVSDCTALSLADWSSGIGCTGKGSALKTTGASSGTSSNPLVETFNEILEEAVTGLTTVAAEFASKRVAEFVEDRSRLKAIAQAAGWAPASGSSSTGGSGSNDPIYRLLTALGETLLQQIQAAQQDTTSTQTAASDTTTSDTTAATTDDTSTTDTTTDDTSTDDTSTTDATTDDTSTDDATTTDDEIG